MTKAYDLKALGDELKAAGVPVAMDTAEKIASQVYLAVKKWAKDSAVLSENKIDDFASGFYDQLDPLVLPQIDKINGRVG